MTDKARVTNQKFVRLKELLMELFQLNQPELDFGLYRVMHARAKEVTQFLEQDLLPQVSSVFEAYQSADSDALKRELKDAITQARALGADPDSLPKVKELKAKLEATTVDVSRLESEVFDHLYTFFKRYYHEGDFLSRRIYKDGVYAIPYSGEEVKLHWANSDQYYIKTDEYLRDYSFRLNPSDEKNPRRVHFRIAAAAEGEHGNIKSNGNGDRRFVLASADFVAEEDGETGKELIINFEYRPSVLTDWSEELRQGKKSPPAQKDLIAMAVKQVSEANSAEIKKWLPQLLAAAPTESNRQRTVLEKHLEQYTKRNTFDYFIHKDLGGFLRRELDFYIKNEVMHLDDIENETTPKVEQYLSKIKAIRSIAGKIIDFLGQLEDFQKKLWLKKKFVVETNYCITLDKIPEEFYPEIAANEAQRKEWVKLFAIDEIQGDLLTPKYSEPLSLDFLKKNKSLIVDTRYFPSPFKEGLLGALSAIDAACAGLLLDGENFHALRLLQRKYALNVKAVYIDPPYNTSKDIFPYKDGYRDSSWLSMMWDRIGWCKRLLRPDGVFLSSIDQNELYNYTLLLNQVFGSSNRVGDIVWRNARDNNPTRIANEHEFILCYANSPDQLEPVWKNEFADAKEMLLAEYERLKAQSLPLEAIQDSLRDFIRDNKEILGEVDRYKFVDEDGVFTGSQSVHNPHPGGYEYEVTHPTTGQPMRLPANGYRFPYETMKRDYIDTGRLIYGPDENRIVQIKLYLRDYKDSLRSVLDLDGRLGAYALNALFGSNSSLFDNPKPPQLLRRLLSFASIPDSLILDFFAGSGTTVQAAMDVARMTDVAIRYIAVEMAGYFDRVLIARVKKSIYSSLWQRGKPLKRDGKSHAFKYIRLESYEDALNNLELTRDTALQTTIDSAIAQQVGGFKEQYILKYMLDVETKGSQSLLNIKSFQDPTAYKMKVKRPGTDESCEVNVDLVETFNWLLGLTVDHIAAPKTFSASFKRDSEGRLILDGQLKQAADGAWYFRTVEGKDPEGRRVLVIWRKRPGGDEAEGLEQDNLVLNEWFRKLGYSTKDKEFDLIYVNGSNNLENVRAADETWKVRLIEEDFTRLMFDVEEM